MRHHHHAGENVVLWHDHRDHEVLGDGLDSIRPSSRHDHEREPKCVDPGCPRNSHLPQNAPEQPDFHPSPT